MEEETKAQIKCPMCGCEEFERGIVAGKRYMRFKKDSAGLFSYGDPTFAKRCNNCRFVAIFTE